MRIRLLASALLTLAAAAAPASAKDITVNQCLRDVDCVDVTVRSGDRVGAGATTGGTCLPRSVSTACLLPGLTIDFLTTPPSNGPYVFNGSCSMAGVYTDKFVQVTAHQGSVGAQYGETRCRVFVGGEFKATVTADLANPAVTRQFLANGYRVEICTDVTAIWPDGHHEAMSSYGGICTYGK